MILEPKLSLSLQSIDKIQNLLSNQDILENIVSVHQCISSTQKEEIEFHSCFLKELKGQNCQFPKSYFFNSIFENCNFSNTNFSKSTFKKVIFKNCNLIGANLDSCYFENTQWINCNLNHVFLSNSSISKTIFSESTLKEGYLNNLTLKNVEFINCNLTLCDFSNTSLKQIDFSTDIISGITIYPNDIYGVILNEIQALDFLKILGIKIKS